jgi:hypothetical protein
MALDMAAASPLAVCCAVIRGAQVAMILCLLLKRWIKTLFFPLSSHLKRLFHERYPTLDTLGGLRFFSRDAVGRVAST